MRRKLSGLLAAAMAVSSFSGIPAWASVPNAAGDGTVITGNEKGGQEPEDRLKASPSDALKASPSDAREEEEEVIQLASPSVAISLLSAEDGTYTLEAEDKNIASPSDEGVAYDTDRVQLQQNDYMIFDLAKVTGFVSGKYQLTVRMNGTTPKVQVLVGNESQEPDISKESLGWESTDLKEYIYHGTLDLDQNSTVKIQEGAGNYGHLDWIKLTKYNASDIYWIEAEDAELIGGATLKDADGGDYKNPRVELNEENEGIKINLDDIPGFVNGAYRLCLSANGARTQLGLSVLDGEQEILKSSVSTPANEKYQEFTCQECYYGEVIQLNSECSITLFEEGNSWGDIDYVRLERVGDYTPQFNETDPETGIRVTADQGILSEGVKIQTERISKADQDSLRDTLKELGKKAVFYSFNLERDGQEVVLQTILDEGGEITAYLPIPKHFMAGDYCVYYLESPEDDLDEMSGYQITERDEVKLVKFQLESYGIYIIAAENYWQLEGEDFFSETTDGGAAANPGQGASIEFEIPDLESFESGLYNLTIRVKGYQNYQVLVNGDDQGTLEKPGINWEEDYGEFNFTAPLDLSGGDTLTLKADEQYGWVDCIKLIPYQPFAFEETDGNTEVTVTAEPGVVPAETVLVVKPVEEESEAYETISSALGAAGSQTLQFAFYDISLVRNGAELQPSGTLQIRLPIPEDFERDPEKLSVYYISDKGRRSALEFEVDGDYAVFETDHLSWYGILNQSLSNELYYEGEDFYAGGSTAGNYYADLQPGDRIEIPLDSNPGFAEGNYEIGLRACAHRVRYVVAVNGQAVGMIQRGKSDFAGSETAADWDENWLEGSIHLKEGDEISLYAMTTKKDGSGPYGWVDYVKLKQTKKAPEQWQVLKEISLEAENYAPEEKADYDTSPEGVVNLADPSYRLELPITLADGFPEEGDDYLFTMYTTGVMRSYEVEVNGQVVLSGERAGSGYELKNMTREVGESLIHLEPGDILAVSFLEQEEGNNWGNYIDRIVLNSNRKAPNREIGNRTGARIAVEAAESLLKHQGPSTGMEDGRLIYEGEAYYTKQNDNPAADLQPGEQIRIPVSDNGRFKDGNYRVLVRSCGNREVFTIRVNGMDVGSISRGITDYGMDEMTTDGSGGEIFLKAGDILAIEGEAGAKYGWVDYIALEPVSGAQAAWSQARYTYEAEDFYTKQKDNPAADLQPGEEILIPLNSNPEFKEGTYYILALSCGDRTAIDVKVNGNLLGSITRNKTNFAMSAMTLDALQRPVKLSPADTIALCSPGEKGSDSGPWGWVDQLVLMEAPASTPEDLEEYRYPAQAYGKASTFLPSADLQPGESLVIPLADHRRFKEGRYRLIVVSNGTRERFEIYVNGQLAGEILRKPSDYGDNGMSWDELAQPLYLRPGDTVTIRGQEGEFYGWVSALVLEPVK